MKKLIVFSMFLFLSVLILNGCGGDNSNEPTQTSIIGTWRFVSIVMPDWEAETLFGSQFKDVEFQASEFSRQNSSLVITNSRFDLLLDFMHPTIRDPRSGGDCWCPDRWSLAGPYVLTGSTLSTIDEGNDTSVTISASISNNRLIFESDHSFVDNRTDTAADRFKKIIWERQ